MVGDLDVASTLNSALGKLTTALPNIKDAASATAALPSLNEASAAIDKVAGVSGQISADGKSAIATMIKTAMPSLNTMATGLIGTSATGPIVKPVLDGIMGKLASLAN